MHSDMALQRIAYRTIPRLMIETIAEQSATMLNMFPAKHGMSPYYSLETIVTQKTIRLRKRLQVFIRRIHNSRNTEINLPTS